MSKISVISFALNILLYILISIPILVICKNKKIFKNRNSFLLAICIGTIIEIFLSLIIYKFPNIIFSTLVNVQGIINYSVFISKIIFSTSSLIAVKILIPALLINRHKNIQKLLTVQLLITLIFCTIGFFYKKTVGFLFGFPVSDIVIFTMNIFIFFKELRHKNN